MRVCKCGGSIRQHPLTRSREAWTCNSCGRYEVIDRGTPSAIYATQEDEAPIEVEDAKDGA